MPIVLALGCALVYGVADYCGGRSSRAHPSAVVAVVGQAVSLVLVLAVVVLVGTPVAPASDWAWGAAGGAAGAIGLAAFYYALGFGAMTVVAPTTAVIGAVVPVVVGVAQGERPRPLAVAGIALAILCVALVSGVVGTATHEHVRTTRRVFAAACFAGLGFGALFVTLARTHHASGLWPLVAARVASVPLLLTMVAALHLRAGPDRRLLALAVAAGVLDMGANGLYLAAVRGGLLSLVAVVSSLYPASTVALAFVIDRERISRWQATGLGLTAAALVLVTLGRS